MSLSHHHQRQLYRIESGLLQADPQLAAMLGIFGKLSASQAMPSWEQVPTRRDRVRQGAALTMQAVTLAVAAVGLLLSALLALLIVVGTRHSHRLPAPGPERTRRSRGSDGRSDPAGQGLRPVSTSTLMADPAAARRASRAPRSCWQAAPPWAPCRPGWSTPCTSAASRRTCSSAPRPAP